MCHYEATPNHSFCRVNLEPQTKTVEEFILWQNSVVSLRESRPRANFLVQSHSLSVPKFDSDHRRKELKFTDNMGELNQPCLMVLGIISIISACIALGGSWYRVPLNRAYTESCDITMAWDLWRHRCTYVDGPCAVYVASCSYCENAEECFAGIPGYTDRGGNGKAYKTVEAFVIMQFIFSVFAMCATAVDGPWAMAMHAMTAICGIIAMSVFIGMVKSYLPPSENDYLYGYGFAWCVIGWICAVFAAVFAYKVETDEPHSKPQQVAQGQNQSLSSETSGSYHSDKDISAQPIIV
eukprot:g83045.t1